MDFVDVKILLLISVTEESPATTKFLKSLSSKQIGGEKKIKYGKILILQ